MRGIGRALIDQAISTVPAFGIVPIAAGCLLPFSAIILSAADHQELISWMDSYAFELQCIERRTVEISPGCPHRRTSWTLPNATISAGKDISGAIKDDRVVVSVQTAAVARERSSAVCRLTEQPAACARSLAAYVYDIGVIRIDGDRHVIRALTGTESSATRQRIRWPGLATIGGLTDHA